jgi:hypothetical protein
MIKRIGRQSFWALGLPLMVLLAAVFVALPGDVSTVIAQPTPDIDEVLPQLDGSEGVINTYRTPEGRLFMEITDAHFDRDFLIVTQLDKGVGEGFLLTGLPVSTEMVTWRYRNEKVELINRNTNFRAEDRLSAQRMLDMGFRESVRRSFKPVAHNKDQGRYLIDVTGLFVSDFPGLRDFLPGLYGVGFQMDPSRSELVSVKSFPENVEIEVDLSFLTSGPMPTTTLPDPKTLPIAYHYSILALPDDPMKPRMADDRIGYFTTTYKNYDRNSGASDAVRLANRWRLEKQDPFAPLSDPVKPIVYYLENTIPEEFRPYVKAGIEAWNAAYEKAGFSNAVIAKDQPLDPDWDPNDARYSTVRWMPSVTSVFAIGPSDVDPRTGEILNADILFVSDWVRALEGIAKAQVSDGQAPVEWANPYADFEPDNKYVEWYRQINPQMAQQMCDFGATMTSQLELLGLTMLADGVVDEYGNIPLEYLGAAIQELTMHEVGHTLGLRHNFKASSAIPNDHLHDVEFTQSVGVSASVMDYNPPNISADRSVQGEYYNSVVGSYDKWVIEWGYKQVGNETLAPHPELTAIAEEGTQKAYTFATDEDQGFGPLAMDPYTSTYDLGSDPVAWFEDRADLIDSLWSTVDDRLIADGEEYWPLRYTVQGMFVWKLRGYPFTTKVLGGMEVSRAHKGNSAGVNPFTPVSAFEQRKALDFLLTLFEPDIIADFPMELLNKMSAERWFDFASAWQFGERFNWPLTSYISSFRVLTLGALFTPERLMRIRDISYQTNESDPFTLAELYQGFTDTIWADVLNGEEPTNAMQREIQTAYLWFLGQMASQTVPASSPTNGDTTAAWISDAWSMSYAEMVRLNDAIVAMLDAGVSDAQAEAHLLLAKRLLKDAVDN